MSERLNHNYNKPINLSDVRRMREAQKRMEDAGFNPHPGENIIAFPITTREREKRIEKKPPKKAGIVFRNALAAGILATTLAKSSLQQSYPEEYITGGEIPSILEIPPLDPSNMIDPEGVERARNFLHSLQPEGTYIFTDNVKKEIDSKDTGQAAIALTMVGDVDRAESALNWMFANMTLPGDEKAVQTMLINGAPKPISYIGSTYDQYHADRKPTKKSARGRAEGLAMLLDAEGRVYAMKSDSLQKEVKPGFTVKDAVILGSSYLMSAAVQKPDGRFNHRPDYQESFPEEGVRISLALSTAGDMLLKEGERTQDKAMMSYALQVRLAAAKGFKALAEDKGYDIGMAFDLMKYSMWQIGDPATAAYEEDTLREKGLLTTYGVVPYDWQEINGKTWQIRLLHSSQHVVDGTAEGLDRILVTLQKGDLGQAKMLYNHWMELQDQGCLKNFYYADIGIGNCTSFNAARSIADARLLTEANTKPRISKNQYLLNIRENTARNPQKNLLPK